MSSMFSSIRRQDARHIPRYINKTLATSLSPLRSVQTAAVESSDRFLPVGLRGRVARIRQPTVLVTVRCSLCDHSGALERATGAGV